MCVSVCICKFPEHIILNSLLGILRLQWNEKNIVSFVSSVHSSALFFRMTLLSYQSGSHSTWYSQLRYTRIRVERQPFHYHRIQVQKTYICFARRLCSYFKYVYAQFIKRFTTIPTMYTYPKSRKTALWQFMSKKQFILISSCQCEAFLFFYFVFFDRHYILWSRPDVNVTYIQTLHQHL